MGGGGKAAVERLKAANTNTNTNADSKIIPVDTRLASSSAAAAAVTWYLRKCLVAHVLVGIAWNTSTCSSLSRVENLQIFGSIILTSILLALLWTCPCRRLDTLLSRHLHVARGQCGSFPLAQVGMSKHLLHGVARIFHYSQLLHHDPMVLLCSVGTTIGSFLPGLGSPIQVSQG